MADSSEKVSFRVDMQCSSLRAEAFLVFDKGSQPTCGQRSADCWQKIFVKAVNDSRPTVGGLSANSRPTVFWGSCYSFFSNSRQEELRVIKTGTGIVVVFCATTLGERKIEMVPS